MSDPALLVFITCPPAAAGHIAQTLVEGRVAACVNLLPGIRSIYRWQGAVEQSDETLLLAKTTQARFAALQEAVRRVHPYELPEIVAVEAAAGLPAYLEWLRACVD